MCKRRAYIKKEAKAAAINAAALVSGQPLVAVNDGSVAPPARQVSQLQAPLGARHAHALCCLLLCKCFCANACANAEARGAAVAHRGLRAVEH